MYREHANNVSGRARKAEATAQAIYEAARRAAAETLDQRLDRVLPLLSELFRRLRPHPIWREIEYSIHGDVKRFLKLQVGEDILMLQMRSSGFSAQRASNFLRALRPSMLTDVLEKKSARVENERPLYGSVSVSLRRRNSTGSRPVAYASSPWLSAGLPCSVHRRSPSLNLGGGGQLSSIIVLSQARREGRPPHRPD